MDWNPKLEKLKIHVYKDKKRDSKPNTFEAMFNPESYSLKYENVYQGFQGINTSGREAKYSLTKPEELSLKLILDDTGVQGYFGLAMAALVSNVVGLNDVYKQVQRFLKLTCYMDGDIHEPKYLKVQWGDLIFDCRLKSVEVNYTLFNRRGQPLRAELDTVFSGSIENSKRVKKEGKNSPDLTHTRTVKAGDKLHLMAQEIYGDPSYYIQLARANNLNNLRKLKIGTNIKLPPIK